jgi:ribosomal protein RSM22 (predicted rRNA methylase)
MMAIMTTPPNLPAELKAALEARLQGLSRNEAAERATRISKNYRGGGSSATIRNAADALAYALARMPATYAAIAASLNALGEINPDFAPQSLLDIGAGPGTATWAAAETWPSLQLFSLLDANGALRELALQLARESARLREIDYRHGEARATLAKADPADLVIASYLIGEMGEAEQRTLAELMWSKTRDTLLVVEPGTPAGYARIIALRAQLIASGAHVVAPCPHDGTCPLAAPDWCHFTQRLPRSRAHKQLKSAELPYEDEKFIYVALTRAPIVRHFVRVLAQPVVNKVAISAKLCTDQGILNAVAAHRDKNAYRRFKKIDWGDAVFESGDEPTE